MGRFEYTKTEKETLKVLKMQEQHLEKLTEKLNEQKQNQIEQE